jgi:hypothetical protein
LNSLLPKTRFSVPFFRESRELVTALHRHLGGLVTVGWDVAITPTGPTVGEGNTYWMPRFLIATDPGFRHRYARVVERWFTEKDSAWASAALAAGPGDAQIDSDHQAGTSAHTLGV